MSSNVLSWVQENNEKFKLLLYFIAILALAVPVTRVLFNGFFNAPFTRSLLALRKLVGVSLDQISVLAMGVYFALLTLMTLDSKKRVQAILLWVGTLAGLSMLATQGLIVDNLLNPELALWLVGGFILGLGLGGGTDLLEIESFRGNEFRMASASLNVIIVFTVGLMLFENHVTYPNLFNVTASGIQPVQITDPQISLRTDGLLMNASTSILFVIIVNRFMKYDANKNFFILGPRGSGKSLFLIGAYLEALERIPDSGSATPLNPSQDLMSMIDKLDQNRSGWIVESTGRGEVNTLDFQYVHGSVFPMNIQLSSIDYAGEYLERLPDAVTGAMDEDDMDTTMRRLVEGIEEADTLVLSIDVERFVEDRSLDISEYFSILQATDDKDVILLATKADHFAEEFKEEKGFEAHRYFDDFVQYVNDRLRQNENVNSLVTQAGNAEIKPVHYQTTEDENGNRVPMRDAENSVVTVGFEELLDDFGRA
jgi:hypothetical protein